jgi:hypothetical protein
LGELSNPYNILRKNYTLEGKKDKVMTVSYLFIFTFLAARVFICPFYAKDVQYSLDKWDPLPFKIFTGALWMLSLIWSMMILNMTAKQLASVRFKFNS